MRRCSIVVLAAIVAGAGGAWAGAGDGLLTAFDRYDVVAVADLRGVEQLGELYAAVAGSDGSAARGIDIVADFGSPAHQSTIDAYLAGETVTDSALRTAIAGAPAFARGGAPRSYEALLAAIRKANASRPQAARVRVWLAKADPGSSAGLAARVLELLAAGRRVLLIADPFELSRQGMAMVSFAGEGPTEGPAEAKGASDVPEGGKRGAVVMAFSAGEGGPDEFARAMAPQPTCLQRLEEARPGRVTTVYPFCGLDDRTLSSTVEMEIASHGVGSLTPVAGLKAAALLKSSMAFDLAGGTLVAPFIAGMDSLLYLGPVDTLTVAPVRKSEKARRVVEIGASRPKPKMEMRSAP